MTGYRNFWVISGYFLSGVLILLGVLQSLTFNMYHIYSHMVDFSPLLIVTELIKISAYLVVPLAIFLRHKTSRNILKLVFAVVPLLSFYTCFVGLLGGAVVSYTQLSVPWAVYWQNAMDYASMKALYVGLLKAFLFGFTIVTVSCYEGFCTRNGAVGVGQATRRSVVTNFLVILVIGYFVTRLFY